MSAGPSSSEFVWWPKIVIVKVSEEITEDLAAAIQAAGIERVKIRSVLTCESKRGVCQLCYGRNLATGRMVERGVRFVQLYHEAWDQHENLTKDIKINCRDTDQACAALI